MLLALSGTAHDLPTWIWLLPVALADARLPDFFLARRAFLSRRGRERWKDLPKVLRLGSRATVLDAGCGLGHGLKALRSAYPQARVRGVERSLPLSWLCRRRCPWAEVRRGDMWAQSWRGVDLVYLFQRP